MKIWFLLQQGEVVGPHTPEEIELMLPKLTEPLIWGKGSSEWLPPDRWKKHVKEFEASLLKSQNAQSPEPASWRYRIEGKEFPPVPFSELLNILRGLTDYSVIDVRSEKNRSWREVYSVHPIVDALGISRRAAPRVPIMGTLDCEAESGPQKLRVLSISEGGLGVSEAKELKIGEKIRIQLQSPNLYQPISANCEVVYIGKEGYAGLKFVVLPHESRSLIIEYVKKFETED